MWPPAVRVARSNCSEPGAPHSRDGRIGLDALKGQTIAVPMWDTAREQGTKTRFHVAGFAQVQISAYRLNGQQSQIAAIYRGTMVCIR